MPIRKTTRGYTFGGATYKTRAVAERAYAAYLAKKHTTQKRPRSR